VAPSSKQRKYACSVSELCRVPAVKLRDLFERHVQTLEGKEPTKNIQLETKVRFARTIEDVSSIYGNAIPFALQAARGVMPPMLARLLDTVYVRANKHSHSRRDFFELLAAERVEFTDDDKQVVYDNNNYDDPKTGEQLCEFANALHLFRDGRVVHFQLGSKDYLFETYMPDIREAYYQLSHSRTTSAAQAANIWCYLANAEMAYSRIHDLFVQVGIRCESYAFWVETKRFQRALNILAQEVPLGGQYEASISYPINKLDSRGDLVTHVVGRVDWLCASNIIEFKCVSELTDEHSTQCMLYAAIVAANTGTEATCRLINARTAEVRIFSVAAESGREMMAKLIDDVFVFSAQQSTPISAA
jgi:hypothetical protein